MRITFSIVIPTYNGNIYVRDAIESALNQTRAADEIIISDDNSTDTTLEICEEYSDRIKIFINTNGPSGFVNGWNNAIEYATSDYVCILHQDDLLYPTFLEEAEQALTKHPNIKHLFAPCDYIDENGEKIDREDHYSDGSIRYYRGNEYANAYELVKGHIHRCPGVITHRDIFNICRYREDAGHIADDDFFMRVGNYTDIVGILKPLAAYRIHSKSETGHLSLLKINHRLLKDYHYQLKISKDNNLLNNEVLELFRKWEAEYIHRLIIYGFKSLNPKYPLIALRYWFTFSKDVRFGNILYDIKHFIKLINNNIRKLHYKYLKINSKKVNTLNVTGKSTVIFAPHPDDEVIGCGGLIAQLAAAGNPPHIVIMTGGEGSHIGCCNLSANEIKFARRQLTRNALSILGVPEDHIHELNFADGSIPSGIENLEFRIENGQVALSDMSDKSDKSETLKLLNLIQKIKPETIFVPHWGEGWPDHINTAKLVKSILSQFLILNSHFSIQLAEYCVWMPYYNVWHGLGWKNARKLEMSSSEHELKLKAMDAYVKPLAPCGKPWSGVLPKLFLDVNSSSSELYFISK